MNLLDDLLRAGPEAALVPVVGPPLSWDGLRERVEALAGGLRRSGIGAGDRIVLLLPMGVDLYVALLALFHRGAAAVLVDPGADPGPLLQRAAAKGMIGTPMAHLLRLRHAALRGLDLYLSSGFTLLPHQRLHTLTGEAGPPEPEPGPALLTFTTGSTGRPKMMARSHLFLLAQHRALHHHMDLGPADVDLPTLPVFLLHALASGATCVLPDADLRRPGMVDPDRLLRQLQKHGVTTMSGPPALLQRLAGRLRERGETLPNVRAAFTGGGRVPASLVDDLLLVLPNARVQVVYGSTEAEPIAVLDARRDRDALVEGEADGWGALVGRPVSDILLRIDADGGGPGEVQVAGDHVNRGYLDDPGADARFKLPDAEGRVWHRTGDIGRLDGEGRLWLLGREGEEVEGRWPLAVEGAAEAERWVERAGLVAVAGVARLAVQLGPDAPVDWEARLEARLGLRPERVERLPMDRRHNSKVDRPALAALLRKGSVVDF